jgi:hypothetical protein
MVKRITGRAKPDGDTEVPLKALEARMEKLEEGLEKIEVVLEKVEVALQKLDMGPKGLEDSAQAPAVTADSKSIMDDECRKTRHIFLDACSRDLKEGHWDDVIAQVADCLADASLYSSGERSDEWVFLAIYGVEVSSFSRHGKSCSFPPFFPASGYDRSLTDTLHS